MDHGCRRSGTPLSSPRRVVLATGIALVLHACAPTYHTAPRYRHNHVEATAQERQAEQECTNTERPTRTFVTDGCSLWPDGSLTGSSWQDCCVEHDRAYWCGGSPEMRKEADDQLRQCVADAYAGWMGAVMWLGSRVGGHPAIPMYFRWGYGRDYEAGY